jgi:hypothetical protein
VEIVISTGGYSRTASGNDIFTSGFLKQPPVEMLFSLAASENSISTGGLFYLAASGRFSRLFLNFQSVLKFIYIYTHKTYIYILILINM